mmetsp:Transcript_32878/g.35458  ORF Transcript_32878/g.35458 Transcript_32878/m.35458 type:complete len:123 (-) Transcript_32878:266-634(-)
MRSQANSRPFPGPVLNTCRFFCGSCKAGIVEKRMARLDNIFDGQLALLEATTKAFAKIEPPSIVLGSSSGGLCTAIIGRVAGRIHVEGRNGRDRNGASCFQQQLGIGHLIPKEGQDHHGFSA